MHKFKFNKYTGWIMVGVFTIGIITTIAISANIKQSDKLKSLNITSNANYKYCALNYTVRSIITENNLINNIIDVKYDDNHIISKFNLKYLDNNLPFIIDQSINTISQFKNNIIHHEYLYHTNNLHTVIYMRVRWWIISNEIIYYDNINWTLEFNKN